MDTHCLRKELGGNRNGLLNVFFSSEGELESERCWLCNWVLKWLQLVTIIIIITLFNEGEDIDYWSPSSFHNGPPTIKVIKSIDYLINYQYNLPTKKKRPLNSITYHVLQCIIQKLGTTSTTGFG